jgi:hypothetical protein
MSSQTQILANIGSIGMNNASNAAVTVIIAQGVGLCIDNTIIEFANTQEAILYMITNKNYGKAGYYVAAALAFQNGYNLAPSASTLYPSYAVIDPTAQVVKQAAFEVITQGSNSLLFLKIAGQDPVTGLLQPLPSDQFAAFQAYMTNFLIPYIPVTFINNQPDQLSFNGIFTYYPTYDVNVASAAIMPQLTSFLTNFQFNGQFYCGDLESFVQFGNVPLGGSIPGIPGCRNFRLSNTSLNGVAFADDIVLPSGYFNYTSNIINNIQLVAASS